MTRIIYFRNSDTSQYITIYPEYGMETGMAEASREGRTGSGVYREVGSIPYKKWKIDLRYVPSSDAYFIHDAWLTQARCRINLVDDGVNNYHYMFLINEDSPIVSAEAPYDNRFRLRLELEAYQT